MPHRVSVTSLWSKDIYRLHVMDCVTEAGLCVVIPCSFTTADEFTPKHTVWYKCEASQHSCSDDEIIFHSNKNTDKKVQSGFEGRVSCLEPDVSQNNCSIIINDLKESDSGSYQLRVTGELNGKEDGFTFIPRVTVSELQQFLAKLPFSLNSLNQKPTVMSPTLTEGQQATLTCVAPGLCSGSVPEITWTWRGRHISTLTFNPSAEHHNTSVTCKINFTGRKSTEETLTVHVNREYFATSYLFGITTVREGDVLNLTCSLESFPPSMIVWSKLGSDTNLHSYSGSARLVIENMKPEHSGQYICAVTYMNNTLKKDVNITVILYSQSVRNDLWSFLLVLSQNDLLNHVFVLCILAEKCTSFCLVNLFFPCLA
uniref:B-cell receptor CD22 n=1 Tax=Neolamprologus brichardi TaxID=32507 RepID=A0A3Q4MN54_NEOBR